MSRRRRHHLELLIDAGHAEWTSDQMSIARITNAGYDFINAVDQGESYKQRFLELFNTGMKYAQAAKAVVDLFSASPSEWRRREALHQHVPGPPK